MIYGIYQKNWMIGRPYTNEEDARVLLEEKYKFLILRIGGEANCKRSE